MVTTCGGCITLDKKYKCGWCARDQMCTELNECSEEDDTWLDGRATCPDPVISRVSSCVKQMKIVTMCLETYHALRNIDISHRR